MYVLTAVPSFCRLALTHYSLWSFLGTPRNFSYQWIKFQPIATKLSCKKQLACTSLAHSDPETAGGLSHAAKHSVGSSTQTPQNKSSCNGLSFRALVCTKSTYFIVDRRTDLSVVLELTTATNSRWDTAYYPLVRTLIHTLFKKAKMFQKQ